MLELVFIDEPVTVEARVRSGGQIDPVAFVWRGQTFKITDTGRQWSEDQEGQAWHCFLVRSGGDTFELHYSATGGRWLLARAWRSRHLT